MQQQRGEISRSRIYCLPETIGIPRKIDPLTPEEAEWVKISQDFTCIVNSTVNCLFVIFALRAKDYADFL